MAHIQPSPAAIAALLELPLFRNLEPATRSALLAAVRLDAFEPGEVITELGATPDALYLLVEGEIAVTREGRLVTITAAPAALGVVSVLDGAHRSASLSAFSSVEVFTLSAQTLDQLRLTSPQLVSNLVLYLAHDIRHLYTVNDDLSRHFDDFFVSPNARLVPGPYHGDPFDMFVFVMEDNPGRLARLMPPGCSLVRPLGGRYLITFNFFPGLSTRNPAGHGKSFRYSETAPFIPCLVAPSPHGVPTKAGLFCPELYPDNFLAIALGRELYGFPKRFASTRRAERHVDLVLGGRMVLRAGWRGSQPVEAGTFLAETTALMGGAPSLAGLLAPFGDAFFRLANVDAVRRHWPAMPVFVHKQIPDVVSEHQVVWEIDELDEVPFQVESLGDFTRLDGAGVRFLTDEWFLGGRCLGGFGLRMSFTFGKGREWIDYARRRRRALRARSKALLERIFGH